MHSKAHLILLVASAGGVLSGPLPVQQGDEVSVQTTLPGSSPAAPTTSALISTSNESGPLPTVSSQPAWSDKAHPVPTKACVELRDGVCMPKPSQGPNQRPPPPVIKPHPPVHEPPPHHRPNDGHRGPRRGNDLPSPHQPFHPGDREAQHKAPSKPLERRVRGPAVRPTQVPGPEDQPNSAPIASSSWTQTSNPTQATTTHVNKEIPPWMSQPGGPISSQVSPPAQATVTGKPHSGPRPPGHHRPVEPCEGPLMGGRCVPQNHPPQNKPFPTVIETLPLPIWDLPEGRPVTGPPERNEPEKGPKKQGPPRPAKTIERRAHGPAVHHSRTHGPVQHTSKTFHGVSTIAHPPKPTQKPQVSTTQAPTPSQTAPKGLSMPQNGGSPS